MKDNISWNESDISEPAQPWLSNYRWDDATVAYTDTLVDQGMEIIMLRIDEPFYGYPEETECYYVNFMLDGSGSFLRVELEAFAVRNNELWTANETETICSLDPEIINGRIRREYQNAISPETRTVAFRGFDFQVHKIRTTTLLGGLEPRGIDKIKESMRSSPHRATVRRTGTGFVKDGFPIHFVGAINDRPHCTAGFAGGE